MPGGLKRRVFAGSCLVLKGNGADVAMHCVPPVKRQRMSITLRRCAALSRVAEGSVSMPIARLGGAVVISGCRRAALPARCSHGSSGHTCLAVGTDFETLEQPGVIDAGFHPAHHMNMSSAKMVILHCSNTAPTWRLSFKGRLADHG